MGGRLSVARSTGSFHYSGRVKIPESNPDGKELPRPPKRIVETTEPLHLRFRTYPPSGLAARISRAQVVGTPHRNRLARL
jgi:hypothetical protein